MTLCEPLRQTLPLLVRAMAAARHDWWIVSSAAVALHGGAPGRVGDIDVLLDPRDAEPVFAALGLALRPGQGDALFRSDWFGTWRGAPMPVELFAGLRLCEGGNWNRVELETREMIDWGSGAVPVPSRAELKALLLRFGRTKDLARAATL